MLSYNSPVLMTSNLFDNRIKCTDAHSNISNSNIARWSKYSIQPAGLYSMGLRAGSQSNVNRMELEQI